MARPRAGVADATSSQPRQPSSAVILLFAGRADRTLQQAIDDFGPDRPETGQGAGAGLEAQAEQAFDNLIALVAAAEMAPTDLVKLVPIVPCRDRSPSSGKCASASSVGMRRRAPISRSRLWRAPLTSSRSRAKPCAKRSESGDIMSKPKHIVLAVQGMTCEGCVRAVKRLVERIDPSAEVSVDLAGGRVELTTTSEAESNRRGHRRGGLSGEGHRRPIEFAFFEAAPPDRRGDERYRRGGRRATEKPEIRGAGAAASCQRPIVAPHLGSPPLSRKEYAMSIEPLFTATATATGGRNGHTEIERPYRQSRTFGSQGNGRAWPAGNGNPRTSLRRRLCRLLRRRARFRRQAAQKGREQGERHL